MRQDDVGRLLGCHIRVQRPDRDDGAGAADELREDIAGHRGGCDAGERVGEHPPDADRRVRDQNGGAGQMIDVALYESVFNMMESLLPEYSAFGAVRQPAGSSLPGIAPSNAYRCSDGKYALIAGNGDSIFRRLMELIGRQDLADDPALAQNDGRVKNVERLDAAIAEWTLRHTLDDVLAALNEARIPAGKIYDVADIANDGISRIPPPNEDQPYLSTLPCGSGSASRHPACA